jgi:hypothetical protein
VDSDGEVKRPALIRVLPDRLPVGDDSVTIPQDPGVAFQVDCQKVPEPGQLLSDRFRWKAERPVCRLKHSDHVVEITLSGGSRFETA